MRELLNEDMYLISEIIDKMNYKTPPLTKLVEGKHVNKTQQELGSEIIDFLVRRVYLAKDPLNRLLASVLERPVEEIGKMKLKETIAAVKDLAKTEGFIDFFK